MKATTVLIVVSLFMVCISNKSFISFEKMKLLFQQSLHFHFEILDFLSETAESEEEFDEKETIKYYFSCGDDYNEILLFLSKHHNCKMSCSTLLRRLEDYGLQRRHLVGPRFENTFQRVQARIRELVNGPGSSMGYRAIWHCLKINGLNVPRIIIQDLLKEIDPEGTELRRKHRLKRRVYSILDLITLGIFTDMIK